MTEQSEGTSGILFEPSFDQLVTETGTDGAGTLLNRFTEVPIDEVNLSATGAQHRDEERDLSVERRAFVTQCQTPRSTLPMLNADHLKHPNSYASAESSPACEINGLPTDGYMYRTDACSQAGFGQQLNLRQVHA